MKEFLLLIIIMYLHTGLEDPRNRFTRYPSWNNKMYPIWKDGDQRYKDSWKGGKVTFNVGNDSPTLTGAKVTFTIDLEFPHSQKVQNNGDVVWAEDCTVNGTKYHESEPVYPTQNTDWEAVFPDGTPIRKDQKPAYVFVWKTWSQYWQVADGSSSSLTIDTDDIPLGSYTMDIVIYHYRSKEKFIPLGYASTHFSITDQIPFAVSLDQVNDIMAGDMRFVQNRAIAFTITLHDPSQYLSNADVTFNWDFGDKSGALISRELTVTHTYINSGSFKPQVVIQAVIPDKACDPPVDPPTKAPGPPPHKGTTDAPAVAKTPSPVNHVNEMPANNESLLRGMLMTTAGFIVMAPSARASKCSVSHLLLAMCSATCQMKTMKTFELTVSDLLPLFSEGIEKVEIVQMDNAVMTTPEMNRNVLDITVTCQGSLPKEVCSVILDAECLRPIHSACNMVEPSKECQLVLRHFFNDSGVYCINVSMANDVSLAVTSARVNVDIGTQLHQYYELYLRFKSYRPLKEELIAEDLQDSRAHVSSGASMFWKLLNRRGAADDCPLLQDRPV
uniref:Premelanosome protein b n=1 Tax=Cyclopterus lumpus TaxID=8103 RepID=A0A8C3A3P8_CYCLU